MLEVTFTLGPSSVFCCCLFVSSKVLERCLKGETADRHNYCYYIHIIYMYIYKHGSKCKFETSTFNTTQRDDCKSDYLKFRERSQSSLLFSFFFKERGLVSY